jgi:hypothetical protein
MPNFESLISVALAAGRANSSQMSVVEPVSVGDGQLRDDALDRLQLLRVVGHLPARAASDRSAPA